MKKIIVLVICVVIFTSVNCRKNDCHNEIVIQNNSNKTIIYAIKAGLAFYPDQCVLQGFEMQSGEFYIDKTKSCWEKRITEKNPYEFYIIDPSHYNDPHVYYDCDSIEVKNKVLKHYKLSKNEVKERNFLITYP